MKNQNDGGRRQGPYFVMFPASLVVTLKDHPQTQAILLYVLWRQGVTTNNDDGKWHFRVSEMARTLGHDEKTIRKHLKPLLEMGLLSLTGSSGNQYYLLSEERYQRYLAQKPKKLVTDPLTQNRPPSQDLVAPPLPKFGTLKYIEESKEDHSTVQSCTSRQDGTAPILELEANLKERTAGGSGNGITLKHQSAVEAEPLLYPPGAPQAAPNGAPLDGTGQDQGTPVSKQVGSPFGLSCSSGEADRAVPKNGGHSGRAAQRRHGSAPVSSKSQSSPVFVLTGKTIALPLPDGVGLEISAKRQRAIVSSLNNKMGGHFIQEGPITTSFKGHTIAAYDGDSQFLLLTADSSDYAQRPHVQKLCAEFIPQGWKVMLWTADDQCLHGLGQQLEGATDARRAA